MASTPRYRRRASSNGPRSPLRVVRPASDTLNPVEVDFVLTPSLVAAAVDRSEPPSEKLLNELRVADELARLALAPSTGDGYSSAWRQFNAFCVQHCEPSLPASPQIVALYLADCAVATDGAGAPLRNDYRELMPGRLRPNSLAVHCAAIDLAHEVAGFGRPTKHPDVHAVVQGIRRSFGIRAINPKQPIELDGLRALLAVCNRAERRRMRDRLAVMLFNAGCTPTQLARLRLDRDVAIHGNVLLISDPMDSGVRLCTLRSRPDSTACPVKATTELLAGLPSHGPLLVREVDDLALERAGGLPHALSRQAVTNLLRRRVGEAGIVLPPTGLPRLSPSQCERVVAVIDRSGLIDFRDRSLLLTGWSAALRQSSITQLCWSDFRERDGEVSILLRRDKADPFGEGRTVWLPRGTTKETCPVTAWREWRDTVAAALGEDPLQVLGEEPCYGQVSRHDALVRTASGGLARLGKDGVNDLIKTLCQRAGLRPEDFGSHSLRVGFITEASKRGETPLAIQEVTGHKTLEMVARYTRPIDRRAFAPSRRMGL